MPVKAPATWKQLSTSATVVRFIDSQFDADRTNAVIENTFGTVKHVSFAPMSLRAIFLAMAKDNRKLTVEEVQG
jgi:hypothetical protein